MDNFFKKIATSSWLLSLIALGFFVIVLLIGAAVSIPFMKSQAQKQYEERRQYEAEVMAGQDSRVELRGANIMRRVEVVVDPATNCTYFLYSESGYQGFMSARINPDGSCMLAQPSN